jgi:hypothetical protein
VTVRSIALSSRSRASARLRDEPRPWHLFSVSVISLAVQSKLILRLTVICSCELSHQALQGKRPLSRMISRLKFPQRYQNSHRASRDYKCKRQTKDQLSILGHAIMNDNVISSFIGSFDERGGIPLTEYCRVFLGQRRGARRLEGILRVVAAAVS